MVTSLVAGGEAARKKNDIENWRAQAERPVVRWKLCVRNRFYGQATKGVRVDALAQRGDEGRGQLR